MIVSAINQLKAGEAHRERGYTVISSPDGTHDLKTSGKCRKKLLLSFLTSPYPVLAAKRSIQKCKKLTLMKKYYPPRAQETMNYNLFISVYKSFNFDHSNYFYYFKNKFQIVSILF